ncbi:MAG: polysaccharide deacetylase family protein [Bacteroidota bacterium]
MRPRLLHKLAPLVPLSLRHWVSLSGQKLLMPVYHLCSTESVPHVRHLYQVRSTEQFAEDVETFLRYYEPIGLPEVIAVLKGEKELQKPSFWLSFDDGLREVYEEAFPILQQKGVPATLFLNNDFIGNRALFFRYKVSLLIQRMKQKPLSPGLQSILRERLSGRGLPREISPELLLGLRFAEREFVDELGQIMEVDFVGYLNTKRPYLDHKEIRHLLDQGFHIGAHSLNHPEYRYISYEEQIRQTRESMQGLVKEFGIDYRAFAFPFTDFGVSRAWFDEMLSGALDVSFGAAGLKSDLHPQHGQRVPLEGTDDSALAQLKAEYLYYALKAPLGKNQISQR